MQGFRLLVGKSGTKMYFIRYTPNGKKGSMSLGSFPD
ncbi:Arm DNA-binding domain-containing protein [Photobacterium sagamiensis]